MSERLLNFGGNVLALAYDLDARLAQWDALRATMVRAVPAEFTRDEWAYLVTFVAKEHLESVFTESFGERADGGATSLFRPRGSIAIWLPGNVSLLGPLVLVLSSLAGVPMRLKAGSKSNDLCAAFTQFAIANLGNGGLRDFLRDSVSIERFDRHDPRNSEMAAAASVRIAFGSDAAVAAIHSLPHPAESIGISFGDHRSEAWVETAALNDTAVATLIKVFAIYGQAGCTSPRRVVLLDGSRADAEALRGRMQSMWSSVMRQDVLMHIASLNLLHAQLNAAAGRDVLLAERGAAVLGIGSVEDSELNGLMSLSIVSGSLEEAVATLPRNIQTIGHCLSDAARLLPALANTRVKRFVPVAQMHHFGPVWDGMNFFRQLFEQAVILA